ncbi:MAG: hypothetical protein LC800_21570, partial [Acidobacteria bacterium]|nr:hypothetical protein [Acidobacteriota bacterium]
MNGEPPTVPGKIPITVAAGGSPFAALSRMGMSMPPRRLWRRPSPLLTRFLLVAAVSLAAGSLA